MSEKASKSWRTRRARKAAETRKKNIASKKLSAVATKEVGQRKQIQKAVAENLRQWWRSDCLYGIPSKTRPKRCIVCGESEELGLAIHHIDPEIKKGEEGYNSLKNKAPVCGTCHNIIT